MKREELVCIVCPVGCSLVAEETSAADGLPALTVTGNRCPRGAAYAREEVQVPKRTITATCAISGDDKETGLYALRRVPVKTNIPCPKEKISALLAGVYRAQINLTIKIGDTVIANWQNSGIDVVATRSVRKNEI
jgi:CxxC motif-containing protein